MALLLEASANYGAVRGLDAGRRVLGYTYSSAIPAHRVAGLASDLGLATSLGRWSMLCAVCRDSWAREHYESALHHRFSEYRIRGEWFRYTERIVEYFDPR